MSDIKDEWSEQLAFYLGKALEERFGDGTVYVLVVGRPDGEAFILPGAPPEDIAGLVNAVARFVTGGRRH
jgi:hypothetical protein